MLDLAEFPQQLMVSMRFTNNEQRLHLDRLGLGTLDFDGVPVGMVAPAATLQFAAGINRPNTSALVHSEFATAFQGLYQSIRARWINPPLRDWAASHKPWQLHLAREIGWDIPETLMTNDPQAAKAFCDACGGDVVYKQFLALPDAWRETRRVDPQTFESNDNLQICPVIFQRRVAAVADLRVIVVGTTIFAASAAVDQLTYDIDVRMNVDVRYVPHTLPKSVESLIFGLMHRLDLTYGAIDMRLTRDGQYVFLEINPAGEFLYVEQATGQPIAAALAAQLAAA